MNADVVAENRKPNRFRFGFRFGCAVLTILAFASCASSRMSDHETDNLFRRGNYDAAAERLKKGLEKEGDDGRDTLLYLLDLGLAQHSAGHFEEAIKTFRKADKVAEIKDYTSLSKEAATLLTTDQIKDYKAEDFENVLISTYLAMDYALLGSREDAIVEARRVNRKLQLMVQEGGRKYKQNAFARYLSAILYEADGNWNDAQLDYKTAYELEPEAMTALGIGKDLWRTARLNGMRDRTEEWEETFKLSADDKKDAMAAAPRGNKPGKGEIIVLYENGIGPIKRPHPNFYQVPKFYPRGNPVTYANIEVEAAGAAEPGRNVALTSPKQSRPTSRLMDVERVAIQNLDEKWGGIVAKKVAGIVAKEVVANQIRKQNELLGLAAWLLFYASDQADTRSWNLLPQSFQVARIPVDGGTYVVRAAPVGSSGLPDKTVQVKDGQKVFVNFRYMP